MNRLKYGAFNNGRYFCAFNTSFVVQADPCPDVGDANTCGAIYLLGYGTLNVGINGLGELLAIREAIDVALGEHRPPAEKKKRRGKQQP